MTGALFDASSDPPHPTPSPFTHSPTTTLASLSTVRPAAPSRSRYSSPRPQTSTSCWAFSSRRRCRPAMAEGSEANGGRWRGGGGERPPLGSKSPGLTLTLIPTPILPGAGLCSANSQRRVKTRGVGGKTRDGADGDEDGHGHPPHPCHVRHVGEIWAEKDTGL